MKKDLPLKPAILVEQVGLKKKFRIIRLNSNRPK